MSTEETRAKAQARYKCGKIIRLIIGQLSFCAEDVFWEGHSVLTRIYDKRNRMIGILVLPDIIIDERYEVLKNRIRTDLREMVLEFLDLEYGSQETVLLGSAYETIY